MDSKILDYTKNKPAVDVPDLTKVQPEAWKPFLQQDVSPDKRKLQGLEAILREAFPIESPDKKSRLEFLSYEISEPRYTPLECRHLKKTYAYPVRLHLRLITPSRTVDESVYLCEIPVMLGGGTFIINGVPRVVVSQIHRASGVDFAVEKIGEKKIFTCNVISDRGPKIEIITSRKDILIVRLHQTQKFNAITFMRALFKELSTNSDIVSQFYETAEVDITRTDPSEIEDKYCVDDVKDPENPNEVLVPSLTRLTKDTLKMLATKGVKVVKIVSHVDDPIVINSIIDPKEGDDAADHVSAMKVLFERFRPGTPFTEQKAEEVIHERFFDTRNYSLGKVGRIRINRKLGLDVPENVDVLCWKDFVACIRYILKLRKGEGEVDDIDHLENRRVKRVDELFGEELRKALKTLKRSIQEKIGALDEAKPPKDLITVKIVTSMIEAFFSRSELSQVADLTNPLSLMTHQRRISAMGPGGLRKRRAGFEVRDVHQSHYGRICPIETPEGQNIGLINSLSVFASIDPVGFIVTPYRKVVNGRVTNEIVYLSAAEESGQIVIPAETQLDESGMIKDARVIARVRGEPQTVERNQVTLCDVATTQLLSVSASMIPFLEHDDSNRALMGSNMQRQSVPLVNPEPAIVCTGMEREVARYSDTVVRAKDDGVVVKSDSMEITVAYDSGYEETYRLRKFEKTTDKTCFNQRPLVRSGDRVKKGQLLCDGPAIRGGELALGRNVLVAFMSWEGYNYEDAIVMSERLVRDDVFTSIHIEEFDCEVRDLQTGREEITKDIPGAKEYHLAKLDDDGIIRLGSRVEPGDILVGKIAPTEKSAMTPEEKLLQAIFEKRASMGKNESMRTPLGIHGIVYEIVHLRRNVKSSPEDKKKQKKMLKDLEDEMYDRINRELKHCFSMITDIVGHLPFPRFTYGPKGQVTDLNKVAQLVYEGINSIQGTAQRRECEALARTLVRKIQSIDNDFGKRKTRLLYGDDLQPGVVELVRVGVAMKRNIQVGDKFAGRHGNKGVLAKIAPIEDMPYLEDGTPVDIVLNPLGVPSRMNVGQLLETHIGWAAKKMGVRVVTPPFNGATEREIEDLMEKAGIPRDGKVVLYDGRTGEPFKERVTVGFMYVCKLHHLVEDKIHARSTGGYSLITQQPVGGRARGGGQRLGEMEVWALEAYGASHCLQEMVTVKSDDIDGRNKMYNNIVKSKNILEPSIPASFEVLVNELRGLCLNVGYEKHIPREVR